ncbi:methyltransferase [Mesorhizobium sp. M8A.F.Ca.ET.021.01.1.1]|uniref:methyltransferase n=1 Tax=Mesorhizobium sp. M8A.F.Ca.ET.021.01.1.1 TaxID=2496757 RepID=UPI000FCCC10C|nr:methyltransferase [Mesorhizobium sp. M8A.F.Ca.ET.021.01.1.1]RUW56712.1 SAM-dependent methyltransferase [Mesorhizobium sp. M8A.F.Ca.ET.021.01.1.1]
MQVSQPVLEVLSAAVISGSSLTLTGQLDRKLYTDTNKVIEAAGGKWNKKAGAHVFEGLAIDTIEPILLTGTYSRTKQDFGQFDSPSPVVNRIIELAQIEPGMSVLEPSAGIGNIALAAHEAGGKVEVIEIDEKRAKALKAAGFSPIHGNFLDWVAYQGTFDRVVMNPPFAKQADIEHVLHAFKFLKPGGRLVSVMSAGVEYRQDRKAVEFRAFVEAQGGTIERLPDSAFKDSGTNVSTVVVVIDN